jgi:hypothetical protein
LLDQISTIFGDTYERSSFVDDDFYGEFAKSAIFEPWLEQNFC